MKTSITSKKIILSMLFGLLSITIIKANQPVYGNGKLKTISEKLTDFNSLVLKATYINVEVFVNKMPMIEITTDENVIAYLKSRIEKKQLIIDNQKGFYVIPTKCNIKISTAFLSRLETYREIGEVKISGIDTETFFLNMIEGETTKVVLGGKVKSFNVLNQKGEIDAKELMATNVVITSETTKSVKVNAISTLEANIKGTGEFLYEGSPKIINSNLVEYNANRKKISESNHVSHSKFVKIIFSNESSNTQEYYVSGFNPRANKNFSYGFSIDSQKKITEELPEGSKVQVKNRFGKTLVVVAKDMANKTIKLN